MNNRATVAILPLEVPVHTLLRCLQEEAARLTQGILSRRRFSAEICTQRGQGKTNTGVTFATKALGTVKAYSAEPPGQLVICLEPELSLDSLLAHESEYTAEGAPPSTREGTSHAVVDTLFAKKKFTI